MDSGRSETDMSDLQALQRVIGELDRLPERVGHELRLDLAALITRGLNRRGWSRKRLAEEAGMKPSFVSRVLHSDSNCTFEVAGRLLLALGIEVSLIERTSAAATPIHPNQLRTVYSSTERVHAKVISQTSEEVSKFGRLLGPNGIETSGRALQRSVSQDPLGGFIRRSDQEGFDGDTLVRLASSGRAGSDRGRPARHAR